MGSRQGPSCPLPSCQEAGSCQQPRLGCACPSVSLGSGACWGEAGALWLGLPSHPSYPLLVGFSFSAAAASCLCSTWMARCLHSSTFCLAPCSPQPLLLRTPGNAALLFQTLSLLPSFPSTPSPPLPSQKQKGRKKTVKWGMLTDKPTQLSEASMSVLWMFLSPLKHQSRRARLQATDRHVDF